MRRCYCINDTQLNVYFIVLHSEQEAIKIGFALNIATAESLSRKSKSWILIAQSNDVFIR